MGGTRPDLQSGLGGRVAVGGGWVAYPTLGLMALWLLLPAVLRRVALLTHW